MKEARISMDREVLSFTLRDEICEIAVLFEFNNPDSANFDDWGWPMFIFLFEITFQPGVNRIQHSYSFRASRNVGFQ